MLEELYTDEFKLCCSYYHPNLAPVRCQAPIDELSSCDDLLAQNFFRVALWLLACLALIGNLGVVIFRACFMPEKTVSLSSLLVKNLCVSDLLMGVYMTMIGVADALMRGDYISQESEWRASIYCKIAGFLSFLSSEVSAFTLCLITFDRMLVIVFFPFRHGFHFSKLAAHLVCSLSWLLGLVLASVPLLTGLDFFPSMEGDYRHNWI